MTGVIDAKTWAELFAAKVVYYDDDAHAVWDSGRDRARVVRLPEPEPTPSASASATRPRLRPRALRPEPAPEPAAPVSTGGDGCSADGRIVTPVSGGTVTGQFGENRGDHAHSGTDIAAPTGTTVRAANCGTVSVSGTESGYGQLVCIRHAGETTTCYAHLSERDVAVNEHVQAGQKIGEVGCTGSCTGPHVHFEVRTNGTATNPEPYLTGSQTVSGEATTANRAALPEGEGGTGGATPAEQAAVFDDTGGATAPEASAGPRRRRPSRRRRRSPAPAPAAAAPAPAADAERRRPSRKPRRLSPKLRRPSQRPRHPSQKPRHPSQKPRHPSQKPRHPSQSSRHPSPRPRHPPRSAGTRRRSPGTRRRGPGHGGGRRRHRRRGGACRRREQLGGTGGASPGAGAPPRSPTARAAP